VRLIILVICSLIASYAACQEDKTKPRYLTDALSKQISKVASRSPEERIIRITGSTKDRDEGWYFDQCFETIVRANSNNSPGSGEVRVAYTVGLDGGLIDVIVLNSSGFIELDKHVVSLVRQSEPYPKPPNSISLRAHRVNLIQTISVSQKIK